MSAALQPAAEVDRARTAEMVARMFIAVSRSTRNRYTGTYRPDPLLSLWCTWENVRDVYAREVADDVVHGYQHSLTRDTAAYQLAVERMERARARYLAADRAKRTVR